MPYSQPRAPILLPSPCSVWPSTLSFICRGLIRVRHWYPYRYSSSRDAELCGVRVVDAAEPSGGGLHYRLAGRSLPFSYGDQPRGIGGAGSTSNVVGQRVGLSTAPPPSASQPRWPVAPESGA